MGGTRPALPRRAQRGDSASKQTRRRPPRIRTPARLPRQSQMADRIRRTDQPHQTKLRLEPHRTHQHPRSPNLVRTWRLRPQPRQDWRPHSMKPITGPHTAPDLPPHTEADHHRLPTSPSTNGFGEWREGTSPSRSRRTVRDSRPSYGSHRPASGDRDQLPVGEQRGLPVFHDGQRLIRLTRLVSKSLVFVHDPSNEMVVDAPRQGEQLGVIEDPVIVDPASHLGIDSLRDAGQVRARATVEVPAPDLLTLRLLRLVAYGRKKVHKEPAPSASQATPEGIAEEVETGVLRLPKPVRVLAIHDLRLHRVQLQTQGP